MINKIQNIEEIEAYLSSEQIENLHQEAFIDTYNVLADFITTSFDYYNNPNADPYIAQVCNSIMGAGKSTALQVISMKLLESREIPLLCVFNNIDTMNSFVHSVKKNTNQNGKNLLVITSDTYSEDLIQNIINFQIVAITQQRFRDLKLGFGDFNKYENYIPDFGWDEAVKRTIDNRRHHLW